MINSFPFRSHSKLPYESSISLISLAACLWTVNRGRTCNLHTERPHPDGGIELRPFTCEATVLNAAPPCCTVLQVFFGSLILCVHHTLQKCLYKSVCVGVLRAVLYNPSLSCVWKNSWTHQPGTMSYSALLIPCLTTQGTKAGLTSRIVSQYFLDFSGLLDRLFFFFFLLHKGVFSSCSPELTLRYREDKYPKDQHIIISVLGTPLKSVWEYRLSRVVGCS